MYQQWFLIGLSIIYAIAFLSADLQIDSLYGTEGLIPKAYPDEALLLNAVSSNIRGGVVTRSSSDRSKEENTHLLSARDLQQENGIVMVVVNAVQLSVELDQSWGKYQFSRGLCNLGLFMQFTIVDWFHCLLRINAVAAISIAVTLLAAAVASMDDAQPSSTGINVLKLFLGNGFGLATVFGFFWLSYSSFVTHMGDTFFHFQWDVLLLEMGVLGVVVALSPECCGLPLLAIRVLAFKLLFLSGVVKIQSQCPTWLGLTAMDYHYATQCIPTPLAYYAHTLLSPVLQSFSVAATLVLQTVVSLFFLVPFPCPAAAWMHIGLQVLIALTGNYTFFNLSAALLVAAVFESPFVSASRGRSETLRGGGRQLGGTLSSFRVKFNKWMGGLFSLSQVSVFGSVMWLYFSYPSLESLQQSSSTALRVKPILSYEEFNTVLNDVLVPLVVALLVGSFVWVLAHDTWMMFADYSFHRLQGRRGSSLLSRALLFTLFPGGWIRFLLSSMVCFCLLSFNTSTMLNATATQQQHRSRTTLSSTFYHLTHPLVQSVHHWVQSPPLTSISGTLLKGRESLREPFMGVRDTLKANVHSYGLFRHMTGVGQRGEVARPEVILEGTYNGKDWFEVDFFYKPGNLSHGMSWVAPHQPRLDWQMWFAALSERPPLWLIRLAHLLLEGQHLDIMPQFSGNAQHLLAASKPRKGAKKKNKEKIDDLKSGDPLPARLHSIRAFKYDYDFNRAANEGVQRWWQRTNRREYLPALRLHDQQLKALLLQQKWDTASMKRRVKFEGKFLGRPAITMMGAIMFALPVCVSVLMLGTVRETL